MVASRGVVGGDAAESGECGRHAAGDDIRQPGGRGKGGEYRVAGNHPGVERGGRGRQRQFARDGEYAPPPQFAREDEGEAGGGLRESQSAGGGGEDGAGEVRQAQPRLQAGGGGEAGGDGGVVEAQRGLQAGELEVNQVSGVGDEGVAQAVTALLPAGKRQPGTQFGGAAGDDTQRLVARAGVDEGVQVVVPKRVVIGQAAQQVVFFNRPDEALRVALWPVASLNPAGDEVAEVELLVDGRQRRALFLQQREQRVVAFRLTPTAAQRTRVQQFRRLAGGVIGKGVVLFAARESHFVGFAQADEAVRVAVRAVFFQQLRVGALDGGFVAGRGDAEDVPAVHVRSGW